MTRIRTSTPGIDPQRVTVLVYEYVTGGGLIGQDLPFSWATEGRAIRRAIARDFACVPGVRVVMPIDHRLPIEDDPGVTPVIVETHHHRSLSDLATDADFTILIAPETGGILHRLNQILVDAEARSLGSSGQAIALTGDKARLGRHFLDQGIPTPPTLTIDGHRDPVPELWRGPVVFKPRDGAGSVDTVVVHDGRIPPWVSPRSPAIAQPFLPGCPMSATFLVDAEGWPTLLGIGRQDVALDSKGRISYRGGTILSRVEEAPKVVRLAVLSVVAALGPRSLSGLIGVDYLDDPAGGLTILEINPRPTTSFVGLARMLGPGTIAGAWLESVERGLDPTDWPSRIHSSRQGGDISFLADGRFVNEDQGP